MPVPLVALTLRTSVSPPHSTGFRPCSASWPKMRWMLLAVASGLSILFSATTIGTPAAFAWLMLSMVCGMTPSSAATTSTAMSVTRAPRARICVKASWPGVSMNVTTRSFSPAFTGTWKALVAWVMPPASPDATLVLRMRSSRLVLPWSTWPRMVTTGGRDFSSTRVRAEKRSSMISAADFASSTTSSMSYSIMISTARSVSMVLLIVAIWPASISFLRISPALTPLFSESSLMLMGSVMCTSLGVPGSTREPPGPPPPPPPGLPRRDFIHPEDCARRFSRSTWSVEESLRPLP